MNRRSLILSALAAPFVARTPGLLMPVKPVRNPLLIPVMPGTLYYVPNRPEWLVWDGARWTPCIPPSQRAGCSPLAGVLA